MKHKHKKLEKQIEKALNSRFPGLKAKFTIKKTGSWVFSMRKASKKYFYDLYPGMPRKYADTQLLIDVQKIIREYLPYTVFTGYER